MQMILQMMNGGNVQIAEPKAPEPPLVNSSSPDFEFGD